MLVFMNMQLLSVCVVPQISKLYHVMYIIMLDSRFIDFATLGASLQYGFARVMFGTHHNLTIGPMN